MLTLLKQEKFLLLAVIAAAVAYPLEHWMLHSGQPIALTAGLVLIAFIVVASMRVAHHAELLAEKVGDPYGTMILTLAAVLVEVVILAIMMSNAHGGNDDEGNQHQAGGQRNGLAAV